MKSLSLFTYSFSLFKRLNNFVSTAYWYFLRLALLFNLHITSSKLFFDMDISCHFQLTSASLESFCNSFSNIYITEQLTYS